MVQNLGPIESVEDNADDSGAKKMSCTSWPGEHNWAGQRDFIKDKLVKTFQPSIVQAGNFKVTRSKIYICFVCLKQSFVEFLILPIFFRYCPTHPMELRSCSISTTMSIML